MADALSSALNVGPVDRAVRAPTSKPTPESKMDLGTKLEKERDTARENVAKMVGEQAQYQNDQEVFKVKQQGEDAAKKAELARQERQTITGSDPYKQLQETELSIAREQFHPTERSIGENLALAAATTIMGHMIGKGGKVPATITLAGMNGMMEGIRAGDLNRYKEQKQRFEDGLNNLVRKSQTLSKQLERITKLAATDKEEAYYEAQALFAKEGADFMAQHARQRGLAATLELAKASAKKAEDTLAKYETERQKRQDKIDEENRRFQHQKDLRELQFGFQKQLEAIRKEGKPSSKPGQQTMMAQRAVNSLGGVASALESLIELSAGTTTGLLPNLQTKDGMINYVRNSIGRSISSRDAEIMNTLFTGVGRNLASIEASGAATGLSELSKQMQSGVYINEGVDDPFKVAIKLADIKRIAVENIRPAIDSGLMPEGQAKVARELVERIEKAIPYTTIDVIRASTGGKSTISDVTKDVVSPAKTYASEAEAEAAFKAGELESGESVVIGGQRGRWD